MMKAEPRHGGEHRRAGTEHDGSSAAASRPPGVVAFAVREPRVHDRDGDADTLAEARHKLRRQRNLRHQHESLAAALQHGLHDMQIDLGLAATRHAVENEHLETPQRIDDLLTGPLLVQREHGARTACRRRRRRRRSALLAAQPSLADQCRDRPASTADLPGDIGESRHPAATGNQA